MRVLHLDLGREMRGGQWQALQLMKGLRSRGVDSTLLARKGSPIATAAAGAGFAVEDATLWSAVRLVRRHDVAHAHDARAHTLAALAGGCPLVVSRRVAFAGSDSWLSRWKYARAARFIAVSEHVKQILSARVPARKVAVVYDGVELLPERPAEGAREFLSIDTSADAHKGLALAQEAAQLAGCTLKLTTRLNSDLVSAVALVYITHSEGLGSGALVAMSAGVPVVASRVGGLPEVVRHGENGLLVENRAPEIAAAMQSLEQDRDLVARLGREARKTVLERFTLDRMVDATLEIYRQVLS